jgi:hypothetical protein
VKKKKLTISPAYEWVGKVDITPPMPAKNYIPEWYKNLSPAVSKEHKNILSRFPKKFSREKNMTAKMCVPILDSMMSGYIITMPCDVQFCDPEIYGYRYMWDVSWEVISTHSARQVDGLNLFLSDEFDPNPLKFTSLWNIEAPKGYSLLYTHPFWNYNVPFFTCTGVVDADKYKEKENLPFFIKKNFMGMIEKDTPIAQVIPIKRERWVSKQEKFVQNYYLDNLYLKLERSYKKRFWDKKEYN